MALHGLIAKKVGMTRILDGDGQLIPVTLLQVESQRVTKVLTPERDGYQGVQLGYFSKPEHRLNKPDLTRLRKSKIEENFTRFREFRTEGSTEQFEVGLSLTLDLLKDVSAVDVVGITKGHGFEGSITRFHHATGRMSHGSRFHRRPGSLGMRTTPGRVFKNKEQPGRMGNVQRTIQNLKIVDLDPELNLIALKGSVPGHRDGFVFLKPSVKAKPAK